MEINGNNFCLVFLFVGLGVSNTVRSGAGTGAGSGAGLNAGLGVGISFGISIRNILLLKLSRMFSLALRNNPAFFRRDLFSVVWLSLLISFNSLAK